MATTDYDFHDEWLKAVLAALFILWLALLITC